MSRMICCLSTAALAAATPAMAQVSAADLWAEWQATAGAMGQTMTATVTQTADGLILDNFMTSSEVDGTRSTGQLDRVTMTQRTDGTLSVELSNPYTATVEFPEDPGGPTISIGILMEHEGLDVTVSGPPEGRVYTYTAETITVSEGEISNSGGEPVPTIDMEIVARDIATTYSVTGTPDVDQRFDSDGTAGVISGRFDVLPPAGEEGRLKASFAIGQSSSSASGSMVALAAMQQSGGSLPDGFDIAGGAEYGWSRFDMSFDSPSDTFEVDYANLGGSLAVALSNAALRYDISATGMETRVAGSEIPVPVTVSAASGELSLLVPLAAGTTPSDAALRLAYRDLHASEDLWSMIDPTGQVPRNPVTAILDATAQVQLLVDLMSPEAMEMDRPPGELRALTVSELELSFGDTSLTGTGAVTFAPGQIVPQPVGSANLRLVGGNALLDQLQSVGLLTAEQAGMARGVAGMFTRPGAMPDTLETTIEFTEGGGITANGVPLQ